MIPPDFKKWPPYTRDQNYLPDLTGKKMGSEIVHAFCKSSSEFVRMVLENRWNSGGIFTQQLTDWWADYLQPIPTEITKVQGEDYSPFYVHGTSSCTHAIHLALAALGIGMHPHDEPVEVIVPAFTFAGTSHPILYQRVKPVFCDVDANGNLDPNRLPQLINERTAAIIVVHIHGIMADIERIKNIASDQEPFPPIPIIEDACQAHDAQVVFEQQYRKAGSFGDISCFSLTNVKNLPAVQGGLICTPHKDLADRIAKLANYGEIETSPLYRSYVTDEVGFSYQLNELSAAVAWAYIQSGAYEAFTDNARFNGNMLLDIFGPECGPVLNGKYDLSIPYIKGYKSSIAEGTVEPTWHKFRVSLWPAESNADTSDLWVLRNNLVSYLNRKGYPAEVWQTIPLPYTPTYAKFSNDQTFPVAEQLCVGSFCLFSEGYPLIAQVSEDVEDYAHFLIETIKNRVRYWDQGF